MAEFPVAIITDEFTQDFELACQTAIDVGAVALELRTAWDKNVVDMTDGELSEIDKLAQASNLRIISIASPVYKCTLPGGGEIDQRFEQDAFHSKHTYEDQPRILDRSLQIAKLLGASIVRVFSFWRTIEPAKNTDAICDALRVAVEEAAPRGLIIGLENEHACNIATAGEAKVVLQRIIHPSLGLVWDPANAVIAGEKAFPDGYNSLPKDRIVHVHAKDGKMPADSDRMNWGEVGSGEVNWAGQLSALKADGYQGMVSLETHWGGPGGDKFAGSVLCAKALGRLVAAA